MPTPPSAPSSSSSSCSCSGNEGKCWGKINASSLCASHWTKSRISLCRIAKGLLLSFTTPFQSYVRKFKLSSSVSPPKHVRECAAAAITRAHSKTTRANNFFAAGSKLPIIIHTLPLPFYAPTRGFPQRNMQFCAPVRVLTENTKSDCTSEHGSICQRLTVLATVNMSTIVARAALK